MQHFTLDRAFKANDEYSESGSGNPEPCRGLYPLQGKTLTVIEVHLRPDGTKSSATRSVFTVVKATGTELVVADEAGRPWELSRARND
jgi:hypothetical protein